MTTMLCLLVSSCRKADPSDGPGLVKSMTIDGSDCEIMCIYDGDERLTSVTQCDTVEQYTYSRDSVVYIRTVAGAVNYRDIYTLGTSGLADAYTHIASDGSLTHFTLSYDSEGHRSRQTDDTHSSTFVNYSVENDNTVYDSSASTLIAAGNYTISRTFYANTDNTLSNENFGRTFLGNSSENFKKSETYNTINGQYTINYFYELDFQNGVSVRTMKINDSVAEIRHYVYAGGD